jgi:hypothetical protein
MMFLEKKKKLIHHISKQSKNRYLLSLFLLGLITLAFLYLLDSFRDQHFYSVYSCTTPGCLTSHVGSLVFLFSIGILFFDFLLIRGIRYLKYTKSA